MAHRFSELGTHFGRVHDVDRLREVLKSFIEDYVPIVLSQIFRPKTNLFNVANAQFNPWTVHGIATLTSFK